MICVLSYCIGWDGDEWEMASLVWEFRIGVLACLVKQPLPQEIQCMEHGISTGDLVVRVCKSAASGNQIYVSTFYSDTQST